MQSWIENLDLRRALVVSAAFHLVLLGLFALIRIGWMQQVPEWVEMSFVTSEPAPGRPAAARRPESTVVEAARARRPAQVEEAARRTEATSAKEQVIVPKRRMLEEEEPELPVRASGKLTPKERARVVQPEGRLGERPGEVSPSELGAVAKPQVGATDIGVGGKELPKISENLGGGIPVPFEIEGEASKRIILTKVIPEYPPGLQKEAVVRIRFTVLPNGLVGEMVPLQKADPTLEKVSLEALRRWRFNPLDENDEQVAQQGIITFRYVLR